MISKHIINNSYFYVNESADDISISYSDSQYDMIKIKKKYDLKIHLNVFHLLLHHIKLRNLEEKALQNIQLDILYNEVLLDVEKNIQHIKNEYINNKDFYYQEYSKSKLSNYQENEMVYFVEDETFMIPWFYGENKHEMKISVFMKNQKKEIFSKKINLNYLHINTDNLFMITLLMLIEMDEFLKNKNINYKFENSFIINQKKFLKVNVLEF